MPYIAKKMVHFDRDYLIGENIPDEVVDPSRAAALAGMGLIAVAEAAQEAAGTADRPGGENVPTEQAKPTEAKQEATAPPKKPRAKK